MDFYNLKKKRRFRNNILFDFKNAKVVNRNGNSILYYGKTKGYRGNRVASTQGCTIEAGFETFARVDAKNREDRLWSKILNNRELNGVYKNKFGKDFASIASNTNNNKTLAGKGEKDNKK